MPSKNVAPLSAICGLISPWAAAIAPVAVNNTYSLNEDTTASPAVGQGVAANDTLNGNTIEVLQVTGPAHGALTLNSDGSFTYLPQTNFAGDDTFTYKLRTVPGPVNFIIDQSQSRMQVDAKATTSAAGSATSKDDSRVAGTIKAALSPAAAPFTQARITAVDAHLVDQVDLNFDFLCLPVIGCAATVDVHSRTTSPDWLTLSLEEPGPAASVSSTLFSQLGNIFRLKGVVDVEGSGLATSFITPGPQTMDTTGGIDLTNCQITASGSTLTLKVPVTYTGRFFLDPSDTTTNYVDVTVRTAFTGSSGFIFATGQASANVPLVSNTATVTLHVTPVNDPPVGVADAYSVRQATALDVAAAGVLGNDTDVDSPLAALTAAVVTPPAHGTLNLNSNGSFLYTPQSVFVGNDSFVYRVRDGFLQSNATAVITVVSDDLDGDGMSDFWESAHGLDPQAPGDATIDSDGDGQLNRAEFLANTDPQNAASVLAVREVVMAGGSVEITFSGLDPTRQYQREESADFATWTAAGAVFTPAGPTATLTVPVGPAERYHRLRVLSTWP